MYTEILICFYSVAYINFKLTVVIFHSTSYKIQYLSLQQMLRETLYTTLSNIWLLSFRENKETKTYQVTNHNRNMYTKSNKFDVILTVHRR